MALPDSPLPPTRVNPKFMLIYGPRKVGKTTTLAKLPGNLIIDTDYETGTDYVTALKVKARTYEEYKSLCSEICKHVPRKYPFVTIDIVDTFEEWARVEARRMYKESPIGKSWTGDDITELPNKGGWPWLWKAFLEVLQYSMPLADTVIYVGHVRDKFAEGVGITSDSKELDLTGKLKTILVSRCDTVGHMYRTSQGELGINFQSHQHVLCSSRVSHITGKDIKFTKDKGWEQIFI